MKRKKHKVRKVSTKQDGRDVEEVGELEEDQGPVIGLPVLLPLVT